MIRIGTMNSYVAQIYNSSLDTTKENETAPTQHHTPKPEADDPDDFSSRLNIGEITLIMIGSIVVIAIIVLIIRFCMERNRKEENNPNNDIEGESV